MSLHDDDPVAENLATVADRRRAGRQDVSPELIPILRGQVAPDAPVDPLIPLPKQPATREEWLFGVGLTVTFLLVGFALRFVL